MNAADFFMSIGFDEWATEMNSGEFNCDKPYSDVTINGYNLRKHASYSIEAKINESPDSVIKQFNLNRDRAVWLNLNPTDDYSSLIVSLLVENTDIIKLLMVKLKDTFDVIFVSPASSLRSPLSEIKSHNTLAFSIERLNVWISNLENPPSTIIFVDYDMAEGKSDARNIINRFVTKKLK